MSANAELLTKSHKQTLRFLVKARRDDTIPEEFTIIWTGQGAIIDRVGEEVLNAHSLTFMTLDVLTHVEYLYSKVHNITRSDGIAGLASQSVQEDYRTCFITPAGFRAVDQDFAPVPDVRIQRPPIEITESLARFRRDYPDNLQLAFVMMQFSKTQAHTQIFAGIQSALEPHGMVALRADDKEYHEDLFYNILTYVYGTRFGIAVFERIEKDDFNPNVSLEVGYMMGLRKSVCLLKDRTLDTLHTDLVGKLYRSFDPQDPEGTIPPELIAWMDQKGFIVRR